MRGEKEATPIKTKPIKNLRSSGAAVLHSTRDADDEEVVDDTTTDDDEAMEVEVVVVDDATIDDHDEGQAMELDPPVLTAKQRKEAMSKLLEELVSLLVVA